MSIPLGCSILAAIVLELLVFFKEKMFLKP